MNGTYTLMQMIGLDNVGLSIIIFTIIIYTLMFPLTYKQQKFSKMSAAMNPELQAIEKKYRGKRDQTSMLKMQEETQMVYDKYGTSPDRRLWFAFNSVSYFIRTLAGNSEYSGICRRIKEIYMPLVNSIMATDGY